jgi:hypothetical protein
MQITEGFIFQLKRGVTGDLRFATQRQIGKDDFELGMTDNLAAATRFATAEDAALSNLPLCQLDTLEIEFEIVELKRIVGRSYQSQDVISIRNVADVIEPVRKIITFVDEN